MTKEDPDSSVNFSAFPVLVAHRSAENESPDKALPPVTVPLNPTTKTDSFTDLGNDAEHSPGPMNVKAPVSSLVLPEFQEIVDDVNPSFEVIVPAPPVTV
jgi:hypothetical protein